MHPENVQLESLVWVMFLTPHMCKIPWQFFWRRHHRNALLWPGFREKEIGKNGGPAFQHSIL